MVKEIKETKITFFRHNQHLFLHKDVGTCRQNINTAMFLVTLVPFCYIDEEKKGRRKQFFNDLNN